jgi:hypothetical protein
MSKMNGYKRVADTGMGIGGGQGIETYTPNKINNTIDEKLAPNEVKIDAGPKQLTKEDLLKMLREI